MCRSSRRLDCSRPHSKPAQTFFTWNLLLGAWGPSRGQTANLNGSIAQQHGKCAGVQLQELPSHIQAHSARTCATDADFGANFHDLPAFVRGHS